MAGPNDLSGQALLPSGDAKLWVMPAILELFAFPFAWISVQMFHDHEPWRAIAGYAITGIVLCVAGVLWAVFRKRIADIWPWRKLRLALGENASLKQRLEELKSTTAARSSKLAIHNAIYRAPSGKGEQYDVTDCLRRMVVGDHLVLQIANGNFVVDGQNFVPKDPWFGELKRLHVEYSYDGGSHIWIERPEHDRLLLPEDSHLKEQVKRFAEELAALRKEYQAAQREYLELKTTPNPTGMFTPLQIEAFTLSREILDFLEKMGERPEPCKADFGYDRKTGQITPDTTQDQVLAYGDTRRKMQEPWELKCVNIWRRDFMKRVEEIAPKFGVEGLRPECLMRLNEDVTRTFYRNSSVFEIANNLIYMAHGLDTRKVAPLLDKDQK